MIFKRQRVQHQAARPMGANDLPVIFAAGRLRHGRGADLKIIGLGFAIPIGCDNQPVARGIIMHIIFNAGLARRDTHGL